MNGSSSGTRPLRIVLIVHQFLPRHSAGTEQLTLKVALGLRALGAEVTIIAAEPNGGSAPAIGHDSVRDIPVIRLEGVAILDPFVTVQNPSGDALIREALQHSAPDLIHMFHFNHVGVGVIDIAEELGIPLVFPATDFWWRCPLERRQGPDEKRCDGPGPLGSNCARHRLVIGSQDRPWLKRVADALPAAAFGRAWDGCMCPAFSRARSVWSCARSAPHSSKQFKSMMVGMKKADSKCSSVCWVPRKWPCGPTSRIAAIASLKSSNGRPPAYLYQPTSCSQSVANFE